MVGFKFQMWTQMKSKIQPSEYKALNESQHCQNNDLQANVGRLQFIQITWNNGWCVSTQLWLGPGWQTDQEPTSASKERAVYICICMSKLPRMWLLRVTWINLIGWVMRRKPIRDQHEVIQRPKPSKLLKTDIQASSLPLKHVSRCTKKKPKFKQMGNGMGICNPCLLCCFFPPQILIVAAQSADN